MKLHELKPKAGSRRARKRVGRGPGSGNGVTAGRGDKGQRSRAGFSQRAGFEGGQMPLVRRMPKRGFTNIFRTEYSTVNLSQLGDLGPEIDPEVLGGKGLVRRGQLVKILGDGDVTTALQVKAHKFSASAQQKIEAAGGSCEVL
ncbi:MAG: 50S ribosomal protein L15 [Acidobacteriota bacterium]|nr:50S ribosomal protein L15 [Acidobacteriota bacterium]